MQSSLFLSSFLVITNVFLRGFRMSPLQHPHVNVYHNMNLPTMLAAMFNMWDSSWAELERALLIE
jgi:hypothetical protein